MASLDDDNNDLSPPDLSPAEAESLGDIDAPIDPVRQATPSVQVLMVAHSPGDWFDDTLASIATQDYPRLTLTVVDAAGDSTLAGRVHAQVPAAQVIDAAGVDGFSAAANQGLSSLNAALTLVCHDDVAFASDAIRVMVTEALRSNAGVVGPKLVDWYEPRRLQHVGLEVDRFAVVDDIIEPGEIDQEQFDAVADVFAVPSACLLIRTDLFQALDGFDDAITYRNEEVDLCWRAQLAGARVMIVPDAVVRHRGMLIDRRGVDDVRRLRSRHQLRAVLVDHGRFARVAVLPLAAVLSVAEILLALVTLRFAHIRDIAGAWSWNFKRLGDVRRRRRRLRAITRVRPIDATALQANGSLRLNGFIQGRIGRADDGSVMRGSGSQGFINSLRTGSLRSSIVAWSVVAFIFLFGLRLLVTQGIPASGDFVRVPPSSGAMFSAWWDGWHGRDLGSPGSSLGGIGLLGAVAWLLGGSVGFTRTLFYLGPLVLGAVGIWRLLNSTGSRRSQIGALLTYVIIPLPYAAVATASFAGVLAYGVTPWLLRALLVAQGQNPHRYRDVDRGLVLRCGLSIGVALGLVMAFDPGVVVAAVVLGIGLVFGAFLAAQPGGLLRMIAASLVGAGFAALLAAPWVLDVVMAPPTASLISDGRDGSAGVLTFSQIVRFEVGTGAPSPLVWALLAPLVLPLVLGRSWRFSLSVRLWAVALVSWGITLIAQWGWLPYGLPDPAVLLAPAAAAVAGIVGMAVSSAEHDLRSARFGWRQVVAPLAIVGAFVATLPAIAMLRDGRWDLPRGDFASGLPLDDPADGSYRVLWIGAPEFLAGSGRALRPGVAWLMTEDGIPNFEDRAVPADRGKADLVPQSIERAISGDTARVGRVLGALGVRYVVLVERLAPAPFSSDADAAPVPTAIVDAFGDQLDLQRVDGTNSALIVYRNISWVSVRSAMAPDFDAGVDEINDLDVLPLAEGTPVLAGTEIPAVGVVPEGGEVYVAQSPDGGWSLSLDGESVARREAAGWATAYLTEQGGEAVLSYAVPWWRHGAQLVQLGVFLMLVAWVGRRLVRGK